MWDPRCSASTAFVPAARGPLEDGGRGRGGGSRDKYGKAIVFPTPYTVLLCKYTYIPEGEGRKERKQTLGFVDATFPSPSPPHPPSLNLPGLSRILSSTLPASPPL